MAGQFGARTGESAGRVGTLVASASMADFTSTIVWAGHGRAVPLG